MTQMCALTVLMDGVPVSVSVTARMKRDPGSQESRNTTGTISIASYSPASGEGFPKVTALLWQRRGSPGEVVIVLLRSLGT